MKTQKYIQKGGIDLSPNEGEIFDKTRLIKTIPEGNEREKYINDIDILIQSLIPDFNSITLSSPYRNWDHYNDDISIYSPEFKKYLETANEIIINNDNENIIYITIGKAFVSFNCKNNMFKYRLIKHILNLNKVRVWNKQVLKINLEDMLTKVIKEIGNCDDSILSRNIPSCIKRWGSSFKKFYSSVSETSTEPNTEPEMAVDQCDDNSIEISKETLNTLYESINLVRTKFCSLKNMFDYNIVSYKEFEIKKKENKVYWLTNPAIITSITVLTNTLTTLYSAKERLITDATFKEITDTVNKEFIINILHSIAATTTVLATATTGIGIPFAALATVYLFSKLYRKITDSEYIKTLTKNKEINSAFIEAKKEWTISHTGITSNICALSENKQQYFQNFINANKLIDDYLDKTKNNYDTLIKLNYDFNNVYTIICQEPLNTPTEVPPAIKERELSQEEQELKDKYQYIENQIELFKAASSQQEKQQVKGTLKYSLEQMADFIKRKFNIQACNNLGAILLQNDRSLIATANRLVFAAKDFNFEVVKNILCGNKSTGGKKIKKTKHLRGKKTQKIRGKKTHRRR